jgi:hypothetical protein
MVAGHGQIEYKGGGEIPHPIPQPWVDGRVPVRGNVLRFILRLGLNVRFVGRGVVFRTSKVGLGCNFVGSSPFFCLLEKLHGSSS